MCGLLGVFGSYVGAVDAGRMVAAMAHRGPDHQDWVHLDGAVLGHDRLRILDLTPAADQPFLSEDGRFAMVFNGEIYNYRELRSELGMTTDRSTGDTAVLMAAYQRWGPSCLDRLLGMFALAVWDRVERSAFVARDRFGVKPLYLAERDGGLVVASEIGAFHAAGLGLDPDLVAWSTHLSTGRSEFAERTFWEGIRPLPPGSALTWSDAGTTQVRWYDPVERVAATDDERPDDVVEAQVLELLTDAVSLRFRSDVPVGVCLSGGLDSSALLALIHASRGDDDDVAAFTFTTGDPDYDELPWVQALAQHTRHPLVEARLTADMVPVLAASVHDHVREPYGGIPTLAYANLFEVARAHGVTVLLDGQGVDESFAGYDYYRSTADEPNRIVQGSADLPVRPGALLPDAVRLVAGGVSLPPARDRRVALQLRDITSTKLPRALRYNDRVSMRASRELREPFLDHRLVELGLAQPSTRLLDDHRGKLIIRCVVDRLMPAAVAAAPKRPVQTPQREWLRGPLRSWATDLVDAGLDGPVGALLDADIVRGDLRDFFDGRGDNSFFVWQWISAGMLTTMGTPT